MAAGDRNLLDLHLSTDERTDRYDFRDGFTVARDPHGGFLVYAPNETCFAWVLAFNEVEEKIAREERERLWH